VLGFGVVTLLVIVLAPAVLVAGELVNRYHWGRYRRERVAVRVTPWGPVIRRRVRIRRLRGTATYGQAACAFHGRAGLLDRLVTNPVWIALTAPARWVLDRLRPRVGGRGNGNGRNGPDAGVREPRRPRPDLPSAAVALDEPHYPA
jgi:hypothetical protein